MSADHHVCVVDVDQSVRADVADINGGIREAESYACLARRDVYKPAHMKLIGVRSSLKRLEAVRL